MTAVASSQFFRSDCAELELFYMMPSELELFYVMSF